MCRIKSSFFLVCIQSISFYLCIEKDTHTQTPSQPVPCHSTSIVVDLCSSTYKNTRELMCGHMDSRKTKGMSLITSYRSSDKEESFTHCGECKSSPGLARRPPRGVPPLSVLKTRRRQQQCHTSASDWLSGELPLTTGFSAVALAAVVTAPERVELNGWQLLIPPPSPPASP